jgi:tetratricopeptide (TPR) repeat protein
LHERVAEALSKIYARQPGPVSGQIGRQYEQAGNDQAAAEWFWKAGDYSAGIGAYIQAVAYLKHALDLLAEDDPRRAELLCRIGTESAIPYGGDQEMDFLQQGLDLAQRTGDSKTIAKASLCMSRAMAARGLNLDATRLAQASLAHAEAVGDRETKASALIVLGSLAYYREEYTSAIQFLEGSLAIFQNLQGTPEQDHSHDMARALNYMGLTFMNQKDFEKASCQWQRALSLAEKKGDRPVQAMVTNNLGWLAFVQKDYNQAECRQIEAIRLYREIGDHGGLAVAYNALGHIALHMGQLDAALKDYRIGLREATYFYTSPMVLETLAGLAGVWARTGKAVRAAELLGLAMSHPHSSQDVAQVAPYIRQLLEEVMPPADLEAALQRGSQLDLEQTVKQTSCDLAENEIPEMEESR